MIKGRIIEENGRQFCKVEVDIEAETEEAFITSYIAFLSKLRLAHTELQENGLVGQETASEKQLATIRRLAKEQNKELSTILEYVSKRFRTPSLPNITKEEATHILDLMMHKKGDK